MTAAPQIGDRLAQYEIVSPIGAGGMGCVYRARDTRLDRDVAIKVLAPELSEEPEMRARFQREARAIAALTHPGIVGVYEMGAGRDQPFIVMELLEGQNLRALVAAAPLQGDQIVDIAS